MKLEVVHPTFLIAIGDTDRVDVLRSPLVPEDASILGPVREFIDQHQLVPRISETFADADWMFGEVEVTVYAPALVGAE
jgi:hypothetical protein